MRATHRQRGDTHIAQTSGRLPGLLCEPRRDSRDPLAPPHAAASSMLSRRQPSLTPLPTARCPLPLAHGPADGFRRDWCRWSGPRGAGGDANAIRRARAELSSPEGAHEAGKRSIAADRSGAGTDGALWRGIIRHGNGQLRLAAGHWGIDQASWPAAGTRSRACRRRPVVRWGRG